MGTLFLTLKVISKNSKINFGPSTPLRFYHVTTFALMDVGESDDLDSILTKSIKKGVIPLLATAESTFGLESRLLGRAMATPEHCEAVLSSLQALFTLSVGVESSVVLMASKKFLETVVSHLELSESEVLQAGVREHPTEFTMLRRLARLTPLSFQATINPILMAHRHTCFGEIMRPGESLVELNPSAILSGGSMLSHPSLLSLLLRRPTQPMHSPRLLWDELDDLEDLPALERGAPSDTTEGKEESRLSKIQDFLDKHKGQILSYTAGTVAVGGILYYTGFGIVLLGYAKTVGAFVLEDFDIIKDLKTHTKKTISASLVAAASSYLGVKLNPKKSKKKNTDEEETEE